VNLREFQLVKNLVNLKVELKLVQGLEKMSVGKNLVLLLGFDLVEWWKDSKLDAYLDNHLEIL
jgi:hypothetical protein